MSRARLTDANYEFTKLMHQTQKEIRDIPQPLFETELTNAQLKQNSLRRQLYEQISEDPDGAKILGGDNKTLQRWWKGKQDIINSDTSLASNILNSKRKTFVRFLCGVDKQPTFDRSGSMKHSSYALEEMMMAAKQTHQGGSPDKQVDTNQLRQNQMKFVTLAAETLSSQINYERKTDPNPNRKDRNGYLMRPDKLIKGIYRVDQILDDLCSSAI